ncbi:hypothetical protein K432DRAFT_97231 [Lepidopterella palustris CBS 459.81]|uniref:Uncharacterized protein n=1 Tax=Lepidopterella palustris CBS 459.81 TaxID=1314670 RepID=A0A8E2E6W8_9PEZI|nr:hypothetical protein K432DRAFT_97231 [Lepidopterella palustris CBS 459.81]
MHTLKMVKIRPLWTLSLLKTIGLAREIKAHLKFQPFSNSTNLPPTDSNGVSNLTTTRNEFALRNCIWILLKSKQRRRWLHSLLSSAVYHPIVKSLMVSANF